LIGGKHGKNYLMIDSATAKSFCTGPTEQDTQLQQSVMRTGQSTDIPEMTLRNPVC
jgi:hypothetical protein